jgi:hypothetical protein
MLFVSVPYLGIMGDDALRADNMNESTSPLDYRYLGVDGFNNPPFESTEKETVVVYQAQSMVSDNCTFKPPHIIKAFLMARYF